MGSIITLGIENMELDWGKNYCFNNHSSLFKQTDIKQIPYYYLDDDDNIIVEMHEGYASQLSKVKNRLNMLGYTYDTLEEKFNSIKLEIPYISKAIFDFRFQLYAEIIYNLDFSQLNTIEKEIEHVERSFDLGQYVTRCLFSDTSLKNKFISSAFANSPSSDTLIEYDLAEFLELIDPYITLRIICENPKNADYELRWNFYDVVNNGYVDRSEITSELSPGEKILVVTEGTSDSFVIERTINELFPDISDFFMFIDMNENYPFTGTGNLLNFCKGLAKIQIANTVLVIFDNDTEGTEKYTLAKELKKPDNLLITKLPDLIAFETFLTSGPQGNSIENINGKAVSIECFLDFSSIPRDAIVRWTSYNQRMKQYQGAMENKEEYIRMFKNANLKNKTYNTNKLIYLINHLCDEVTKSLTKK